LLSGIEEEGEQINQLMFRNMCSVVKGNFYGPEVRLSIELWLRRTRVRS